MSHEITSKEKRKLMEQARANLAKRGVKVAPSNTAAFLSGVISRTMTWTPREDPMILIERMAKHKPGKVAKPREETIFRFRPLQTSRKMQIAYDRCETPRQISMTGRAR